jgi:hypothetical protein
LKGVHDVANDLVVRLAESLAEARRQLAWMQDADADIGRRIVQSARALADSGKVLRGLQGEEQPAGAAIVSPAWSK